MKSNIRIGYIDLASGIMIIWLLFYHASYPMLGADRFRILPWLFFFMPWFFYKSGYFFSIKPILENIKKDAAKLLKNFAIWSLIGYVCYIVSHHFLYDDLSLRMAFHTPIRTLFWGGSITGNTALWFLFTLFIVRQAANFLYPRMNVWIILCISAMVAIGIHFANIRLLPDYIYTTSWGLFFFSFGYAMRKYEQNILVIGAATIICALAIACTDIPLTYDYENTIQWYWYVLWYPASAAGCVVFDNICRWMDKGVNLLVAFFAHTRNTQARLGIQPFPIIKWVGGNAMVFYVAHAIICRITQETIAKYHEEWYDTWHGLLIVTIAYVIIIVPLCFITNRIHK